MSKIFDEIMEIFRDTLELEDGVTVNPDDSFEELDIDSLDLLEVVTAIERKYKIEIPDDALKNITTAGDAIALVEKLASES